MSKDIDIRLITKDTDVSKLKMKRYNWDVVFGGRPYQVVQIEGYVHSIVGLLDGQNDFWMYPCDEEPSYENLYEIDLSEPWKVGPLWGISQNPHLYASYKWDERSIRYSAGWFITRNGEKFCDGYSYEDCKVKLGMIQEHPLSFYERGWKEHMVGRKVWFRSQPGIITRWVDGQGCVIIQLDNTAPGYKTETKFKTPPEFMDDEAMNEYYDEDSIKDSIFSRHIWWFRE